MRKAQYRVGRGRVEIVQGSITRYNADALVCPANADLEPVAFPGGVQFAFFMDGGREIFEEAVRVADDYSRKTRGVASVENDIASKVPVFSAHLTAAGKLPARYVIHSVAVGYDPKKKSPFCDKEVVAKSTRNVLHLAVEKRLESVGFPALGTGLYDVPLEDSVEAILTEFSEHLKEERGTNLEVLGLVLYSADQYEVGKRVSDRMFNPS